MNHEELLKQSTEQLVTIIEGLDQTFAGKEQELQAAKNDIETLKQQLTDAHKEQKRLSKELGDTVKANTELSKTIEQLPKKESKEKEPGFTFEGKKYTFLYHKTVLGGRNITSEDVIAEKDLQQKLVSISSHMIQAK